MRTALLERLACPQCRGGLECQAISIADDGDIITGNLSCRTCDRAYPIERGIPRFVPSTNYASSFGYQWNRFRQEQIDSLNGTRQSEDRLRAETAWEPEWLKGKWILDAGCGGLVQPVIQVPDMSKLRQGFVPLPDQGASSTGKLMRSCTR